MFQADPDVSVSQDR